jgi:hydroxymethylpyrimidine/phosphomethylpyrimidine kinase
MSQKNNSISLKHYPCALTIAGSDSGGGAGIQADLKAFAAVGAFGLSAVTAVTAQNSRAVSAVFPCGAAAVRAQIAALKSDFPIAAVKTGMLVDADTIDAVHAALADLSVPLVLDPVMIATSGAALLDVRAIVAYRPLIARATLITPNLPEAQALLGGKVIDTRLQMLAAANELLEFGSAAVLLKGGHSTKKQCADLLLWRTPHGPAHRWYITERLAKRGHGTGCTLSALITAHLARGAALEAAVSKSIQALRVAFRNAQAIGVGAVCTPDLFFQRYQQSPSPKKPT